MREKIFFLNLLPEKLFGHFDRSLRMEQAMVFLRVATGVYFLMLGLEKYQTPQFALGLPGHLHDFAVNNPVFWYRDFLEGLVVPNADIVALIVPWMEMIVGGCLILGFLLHLSIPLMLFLNVNYLLATQHYGLPSLGINLAFIAIGLTLYWSQAGAKWGLDRFVLGDAKPGRGRGTWRPAARSAGPAKPKKKVVPKRVTRDAKVLEMVNRRARVMDEDDDD